jgi:hypothetical protein
LFGHSKKHGRSFGAIFSLPGFRVLVEHCRGFIVVFPGNPLKHRLCRIEPRPPSENYESMACPPRPHRRLFPPRTQLICPRNRNRGFTRSAPELVPANTRDVPSGTSSTSDNQCVTTTTHGWNAANSRRPDHNGAGHEYTASSQENPTGKPGRTYRCYPTRFRNTAPPRRRRPAEREAR